MRRSMPVLLAMMLGACSTTHISSGAEYLAARPEYSGMNGTELDKAVVRAANVEPLLRFPAKLGLARISHGQHVPVPPREADAWIAFAKSHAEFGEFIPISPLIGQLMADSITPRSPGDRLHAINQIRLGAARQHVDAVLAYTVAGSSSDRSSPLSLLDLTIVGAYLVPSRILEGTAVANGILFDVRNGYPYATLTSEASESGFVPTVGSSARVSNLQVDAQVAAVGKLVEEADKTLTALRFALQEKELQAARKRVAALAVPAARVGSRAQ